MHSLSHALGAVLGVIAVLAIVLGSFLLYVSMSEDEDIGGEIVSQMGCGVLIIGVLAAAAGFALIKFT